MKKHAVLWLDDKPAFKIRILGSVICDALTGLRDEIVPNYRIVSIAYTLEMANKHISILQKIRRKAE